MKIVCITSEDDVFPTTLTQLAQPPKQLFVLGNTELLSQPALAIVGSRHVTSYGQQVTTDLAAAVAGQGIVVISGLALGVDGIAHRAALQAGGKTIAILANGLDKITPRSHRSLAIQILEQGGTIISEYPEGMPPLRHSFVARNRLVAGLAQAVLITEAAAGSGSLHTASFALEQGKDVLAVPGNITSPMSQGTNQLIKSGATPITSAADLLSHLQLKPAQVSLPMGANAAEQAILDALGQGITDGNQLLYSSELDAALFNQSLTMLELHGHIKPVGGGHWQLA